MIKRVKNLWDLSRFEVNENKQLVEVIDEPKPKGQATIIDMETPIDLFPNSEENV